MNDQTKLVQFFLQTEKINFLPSDMTIYWQIPTTIEIPNAIF